MTVVRFGWHLLFALTVAIFLPIYCKATTVRGVVIHDDGKPWQGIGVGLYSAQGNWRTGTDAAGRFEFHDVTAGTYEIQAVIFGRWAGGLVRNFVVGSMDPPPVSILLRYTVSIDADLPSGCEWGRFGPEDDTSDPCFLGLSVDYVDAEKGSLLRGRVSRGCPSGLVAGATVALWKMGDRQPQVSLKTDAQGEFRFEDLKPGRYALGVSHTGFHDTGVSHVRVKYEMAAITNLTMEDTRYPASRPGGLIRTDCLQ